MYTTPSEFTIIQDFHLNVESIISFYIFDPWVFFLEHCSRYDEKSTNNDIALLKLKQKIDFKKYSGTVTPVCLPDLPRKYYGELVSEMLESVVVLQTKSK